MEYNLRVMRETEMDRFIESEGVVAKRDVRASNGISMFFFSFHLLIFSSSICLQLSDAYSVPIVVNGLSSDECWLKRVGENPTRR